MKTLLGLLFLLSVNQAEAFIGGIPARPGEFPFTVGFRELRCGGSKIAPRVFLTAAHCLMTKGPVASLSAGSRLGVHSRDSLYTLRVQRVEVHSSFVSHVSNTMNSNLTVGREGVHDLALIEVVEETPYIPMGSLTRKSLAEGDEVVAGGFGCTSNDMNLHRLFNAFLEGPLTYKSARKNVKRLKTQYLVLGPEDADGPTYSGGCYGDSGGPAYRWEENRLVIVGVNTSVSGYLELNPDNTLAAPASNVTFYIGRVDQGSIQSWIRDWIAGK